jgi:2-phosphosulfolactate phosphatase
MKLDVYFTPAGLNAGDLTGRGVIVIDVLRASTTIVSAIANGAKAVIPAASSEEAVRLTANLEKNTVVLAGERRLQRIEGFNLGNSPREITGESVGGKTVFLATTNGTPALVSVAGADPVMVGGAINFTAAAARAAGIFMERGDLAIICAGREKRFALEDAYTAGRFVKALRKGNTRKVALNDAASVALDLAGKYKTWLEAFEASEAARLLKEVDLAEDVTWAARADRFDVVPTYADRRIT